MNPGNLLGESKGRGSAIGLAIVAAHAGLIAALLNSALTRQSVPAAPIVVHVLPAIERPPETPKLFHPDLAHVQPILVPQPEIEVPSDSVSTVVAAVATASAREVQPSASPAVGVSQELPAMSDIAYLQQPAPRYPSQSRHAREEGLVILRVTIDETGRVVAVDIQRSSGHPRLDEEARNAVSHALFKPYMDHGVARASLAVIPIEFSLHRS